MLSECFSDTGQARGYTGTRNRPYRQGVGQPHPGHGFNDSVKGCGGKQHYPHGQYAVKLNNNQK